MEPFDFGQTALGNPIPAYRGGSGPHLLILGGVHGDELEGVVCAEALLEHFRAHPPQDFRLTLVPAFNPDGVRAGTRLNSRGVDLNRNLPTRDWDPKAFNDRYPPGPHAASEPENQALVALLDREKPRMVFSLHSWKPLLNINGDCRPEAEAISALTGYAIEPTIGYPTPGCLGTYAGLERDMPTLTYEIERGLPPAEVCRVHVPAVLAGIEVFKRRAK
jgi:protein MpaA